ncbi:unnamed protein product [Adineta steineri]|uniref:Ig-like domain-containing protein n=1 Tax=Adineta steineri TaxID=433720 RepID=A0A815LZE8_9BILA|nr:unnamed protein product [Adineta steineri]CAF1323392.1 unnamed protein product [Adineta steineri]CAF1413436.1 unnamed protein product [Adineta steineri]CAF1618286.1 unnamed protein product [Adineta steineri]
MLWAFFISFLCILKTSSSSVDINGENRTIIKPLNSNVTVTSGQKAILTCTFDRINHDLVLLSSHQLIWIRQNHATYDADLILAHNQDSLISDDRLTIQRTDIDYSLIINNVNIDDEGIYVCEVNTQPPQKTSIHLYVQGKIILYMV